jgi:hypothetical protein
MTPVLTDHAIERYRERVTPGCSRAEARSALERFVRRGRARPTPRHWMTSTRAQPGVRFVYYAPEPRACAIVVGQVVVTVITAELVRRFPRSGKPGDRHARRERQEPQRWRWDGHLGSDDELRAMADEHDWAGPVPGEC